MSNNRKILFIEDDPAHAKLMLISFAKHCSECEIIHITDGQKAIDWLKKIKNKDLNDLPRLILLDLNIPTLNGIEVLKKIKNDDILKFLPVVILTTSNSNSDIKSCYERYANSYLVKPIIYSEYSLMMQKIKEYWMDSSMPINVDFL